MKRLIFSLILIGTLFAPTNSYALRINVSDASLTFGEQITVILNFKGNRLKDVYAIDVAVDFNPELLRLDQIDNGSAAAHFEKVENLMGGAGKARIALIGLSPLNVKEGELLKLTFTARDKRARKRDKALTVSQVLFSTDETTLSPKKIRQGKLIIYEPSAN